MKRRRKRGSQPIHGDSQNKAYVVQNICLSAIDMLDCR